MKGKILALALFVFALAGCSPADDPRNVAEAYATRAEADRLSAQAAADLAQAQAEREIVNAQAQTRLAIYQAQKQALIDAWRAAINVLALVFTAALGYWALRTAQTAATVTQRVGFALAARAELQAALVKPDRVTRLLPVQVMQVGGQWFATNHATGAVYRIDDRGQAPNAQMISAMAVVAQSGVLAMEARKARGSAGSASAFGQISPEIVYPVGDELMEAR